MVCWVRYRELPAEGWIQVNRMFLDKGYLYDRNSVLVNNFYDTEYEMKNNRFFGLFGISPCFRTTLSFYQRGSIVNDGLLHYYTCKYSFLLPDKLRILAVARYQSNMYAGGGGLGSSSGLRGKEGGSRSRVPSSNPPMIFWRTPS